MKEIIYGRIKFVNDRNFRVEGWGKVVLWDGHGKEVVIGEILYVSGLKTNFISLGQLLHKGFIMRMEDNCLNIFENNKRLVTKENLS